MIPLSLAFTLAMRERESALAVAAGRTNKGKSPPKRAFSSLGYYSFGVGFEMSSPFLLQILILIPVVFEKNLTVFESCLDSK